MSVQNLVAALERESMAVSDRRAPEIVIAMILAAGLPDGKV
jgi:hypothetical protein